MSTYPYDVTPDGPGYLISFPDVPEALSGADSGENIERIAGDCLATALAGYALEKRPRPRPSRPAAGQHVVVLPALVEAKLALIAAMTAKAIKKTELARILGVDESLVRRLVDLDHRSHIGEVERALAALGKRLDVRVKNAA